MQTRMTLHLDRKWVVILILSLVAGPALYGWHVWEEGNFHVVSEGRVYRSGQLNLYDMAFYVRQYNIKSVLNLRGESQGARWYREERTASELLGLQHYDHGISADREVDLQDIESILAVIRDAPKPILIHGKFGADRTGLIAAAYLYGIERKSLDDAVKQLSFLYGHFPYLWTRTGAMDRSFWRYASPYPLTHEDQSLDGSQAGWLGG